MARESVAYSINLRFHPIKLPPVRDILVLGTKFPQGKASVIESFRFIAPDEFEMFDIEDPAEVADAVLIHKSILRRVQLDQVLDLLRRHVFPYMSEGEALNVEFDATIKVENITLDGHESS